MGNIFAFSFLLENVPASVVYDVRTDVGDPNTGNNSATDSDSITLKADLKVTVTDGKTASYCWDEEHLYYCRDQWRSK